MLFVILGLATFFLFVITMMLFGKVPAKTTGALSGIVGVTGSILILYMVATDALAAFGPTVTATAGVAAFGFFVIYMLIAAEVFGGGDFKATGWMALIVGVVVLLLGLGFGLGGGLKFGDALPPVAQFGWMFLVWAIAFGLIWLVFGLGMTKLTKLLAWWLLIPTTIITVAWPVIMFTNRGVIGEWW